MHSIWPPGRDFSINFFGFELKINSIQFRNNKIVLFFFYNAKLLEGQRFWVPTPKANSSIVARRGQPSHIVAAIRWKLEFNQVKLTKKYSYFFISNLLRSRWPSHCDLEAPWWTRLFLNSRCVWFYRSCPRRQDCSQSLCQCRLFLFRGLSA